jgi:hypothetical protein
MDEFGDMCQTRCKGVIEEMNAELTKIFTKEEIGVAITQMAALKALGPDGYTAEFFQKNWVTIGDEVCLSIIEILNSEVMPYDLNKTNIVLIPKTKTPACVIEFRPISLYNVLYKVLSKVLANRLKRVLPAIISPT